MSRAGQKYKKRLTRNKPRKVQKERILYALWLESRRKKSDGIMTMAQIARCIEIKPSNAILIMLKELQVEGKVDCTSEGRANVPFVWLWSYRYPIQATLVSTDVGDIPF